MPTKRNHSHSHKATKATKATYRTSFLYRAWTWYHRPGVRPVHFHIVRTAMFFVIAAFTAVLFSHEMHAVWGKEISGTLAAMKGIELICEVLADRVFPVGIE